MWLLYAFLSAFFYASTDPLAKRILPRADPSFVGWAVLAFSTPFLAIPFFAGGVRPITAGLAATVLAAIPLEIAAAILYYKALRESDISLVVPLLALTPVFSVVTAYLLLGERIQASGLIGILLITAGVYSLNIKEARAGLGGPILAIVSSRGSRYMVLVALIYGITSSVAKRALLESDPASMPFIYNVSISVLMAPLIIWRRRRARAALSGVRDGRDVAGYALIGLLAALSSICHFKAVSAASVAYVISIKRLSLLMSVGYGWLLFKERDVHIRFASTACMVIGVVMVVFS